MPVCEVHQIFGLSPDCYSRTVDVAPMACGGFMVHSPRHMVVVLTGCLHKWRIKVIVSCYEWNYEIQVPAETGRTPRLCVSVEPHPPTTSVQCPKVTSDPMCVLHLFLILFFFSGFIDVFSRLTKALWWWTEAAKTLCLYVSTSPAVPPFSLAVSQRLVIFLIQRHVVCFKLASMLKSKPYGSYLIFFWLFLSPDVGSKF